MNRKRVVLFAALAAAVFVLLVLISAGVYPIARVNGSFISARYFARQYSAATIYSGAVLKTISDVASSSVRQDVPEKDMRAVVLDQLVEQTLSHARAKELLGDSYDSLIQSKIAKYEADNNLKGAVGKLFGLSYEDFRSLVLVPLAEKELLSARLFLENKHYEDWIKGTRASASVSIYSPVFRWDGARVVAK
jgi:SurA N-terminal domain